MHSIKINKKDRKGISSLVSTVLLILISITAVALIATMILTLSKTSLDLSPGECISAQSKSVVAIIDSCYDSDSNNLEIQVRRSTSELDYEELKFQIFFENGEGNTWYCGGDCNDFNASINPNATESCNFVDDDCDSLIDEGFDQDGDLYTTCNGDCDDTNASINPGATEL